MKVSVRKRNGAVQSFDSDKILAQASRACKNLQDVSSEEIVNAVLPQLYNGISSKEISDLLILVARSKIEIEPNYSYVAARILLEKLYKEVGCEKDYAEAFINNVYRLVSEGILSRRVLGIDIEYLAAKLKPERDFLFKYHGLETLYGRYFLSIDNVRLEAPQGFWMRVAIGLCFKEKEPEKWAEKFYEILSTFRFCPGTPTLFNSATIRPQLSSCFLATMDDSIHGIFGTIHDLASLSQHAGGLGIDTTPLRGTGAKIRKKGNSGGLIPWLKNINSMLVAVDQEGKRKGAGDVYIEPWHIDVEDFINLKRKTGDERLRCHDLHTSLWIPDEFMRRVKANEDWYLFSPDECPRLHELYGEAFVDEYQFCIKKAEENKLKIWKKIAAKELYRKILKAQLETGHPWATYKDACNEMYSQKDTGVIHSSNLCTEILRHTIPTKYDRWGHKKKIGEVAVCTIGSINDNEHIKDGKIDEEKLKETCYISMRMLDNVVDLNYYPIPEAKKAHLRHRPVGLGQMGFVDVLRKLDIPYCSNEAVKIADEWQETISYYATLASIELAKERGPFKTFKKSEWYKGNLPLDNYRKFMLKYRGIVDKTVPTKDWDVVREGINRHGIRNASLTAIAPTATISYICGCKQSIEPEIGVIHVYGSLTGEMVMIDEYFVNKMKEMGIWGIELLNAVKTADGDISKLKLPEDIRLQYMTAFNIDYHFLMDAAAARQKWIDMGQSFNLYCDKPSLKYLAGMYDYAWQSGLKTTYYVRSKAASSVEKVSFFTNKNGLVDMKKEKEEVAACKFEPGCQSCQ
jgi:ribonucleoside-diphosphate reductase alpha chain